MNHPTFESIFGRPAALIADAPGRVNLIGEHTDYNDGFVLPTAIPQRTRVQLTPRDDRQVRAASLTVDPEGKSIAEYELGKETPGRSWADYLQGVTKILAGEGHEIRGFDLLMDSTVPMGSGLSSSAAFEISVMRALRQAFDLKFDDITMARYGQRVENEFVGARVGIMDQMASALADSGTALFLDTRDFSTKRVNLPEGADLIVINSGITHSNVSGEYNTRRGQCEEACRLLGIKMLRDFSKRDLYKLDRLPAVLMKRARHVITENDRVLSAVQAIEAKDLVKLGNLFNESHTSMSQDYQVSTPEMDLLVEIAQAQPEIFGARMTGGGFGGSIVALVKKGQAAAVAERIARKYAERTDRKPTVLVPNSLM